MSIGIEMDVPFDVDVDRFHVDVDRLCRAVGIVRFSAQVGLPRMVDEGLHSEQRGRREEDRGREEGGVEVLGVVLEIVGLVLEGPGDDPGASWGSSWMSWGVVMDCSSIDTYQM